VLERLVEKGDPFRELLDTEQSLPSLT